MGGEQKQRLASKVIARNTPEWCLICQPSFFLGGGAGTETTEGGNVSDLGQCHVHWTFPCPNGSFPLALLGLLCTEASEESPGGN